MTVGVKSAGVDLDSIFALFTTGRTPAATTYIRTGSGIIDLSLRYENIIYGTGPSATGITTGSVHTDLADIFCTIASDWNASLPSFPTAFTTSPQPAHGTNPMTVTLTSGPAGPYTYVWSYTTSGATTFTIASGSSTATIQWSATGVSAEPGVIGVTCTVTAPNGAVVSAHTSMRFNVPGGG